LPTSNISLGNSILARKGVIL